MHFLVCPVSSVASVVTISVYSGNILAHMAQQTDNGLTGLIARLHALLDRVEPLVPAIPDVPDFSRHIACRWRVPGRGPGFLQTLRTLHDIRLEDLRGIDRQRDELERNTRQFLAGLPANNALLTGARGNGKSSLVKALLNRYQDRGLRLIEVDAHHLVDLPDIVSHLADQPQRFIIFCDDLSFEADEPGYKALKSVLDGSFSVAPDNVLIYATSNRRHLMPEYLSENREARMIDGEIHPGEAVEEKVSLSERFGLWLSFQPFDQDTYLEAVWHWLERLGADTSDHDTLQREALQWALARGSRSGRVAWQFARDTAGQQQLGRP